MCERRFFPSWILILIFDQITGPSAMKVDDECEREILNSGGKITGSKIKYMKTRVRFLLLGNPSSKLKVGGMVSFIHTQTHTHLLS